MVPQTKRISKAKAWHILQNLVLPKDRNLTDGSKFCWWLWVANLAHHQVEIIGPGIRVAELVHVDAHSAVVAFTRVDQSVTRVRLAANRGVLSVHHVTQRTAWQ